MQPIAIDPWGVNQTGNKMNVKCISLAAALALAGTGALAQGNAAGGSTQTGGPASNTTAGDHMEKGAMTKPSPKDASTQGAGTAGAVDKKGDATSPGGTMKK
jgi:hypothetical protein